MQRSVRLGSRKLQDPGGDRKRSIGNLHKQVCDHVPGSPWIILLAGVFMETSSAIIILSPVFLPLVKAMGISTVHFGILFVVGIAIGMITPPVAINLFVASGITGLPIERISKSVIPYLIGLIIVFFMIVYVPLLIPDLCNRIRNHNT